MLLGGKGKIKFNDLLKSIIKHWVVILVILLLFTASGMVLSKFIVTKEYKSTSRALAFVELDDPKNESVKAMTEVVATTYCSAQSTSSDLYVKLAEQLEKDGVGSFSGATLQKAISFKVYDKTVNIITVTCTWDNPYKAQTILNAYNALLNKTVGELPFNGQHIKLVVSESPDLNLEPSKPSVTVWTLVAFVLGAIVAVVAVLIMEFANSKIHNIEDIPAKFGTVGLAEIPDLSDNGVHKNIFSVLKSKFTRSKTVVNTDSTLITDEKTEFTYKEAYNMLAINLLYAVPNTKCKKIAVCGATPDSGKTTVSINLAISLTNMDKKVLLIDNDLQSPSIAPYLKLKHGKSLADIICLGDKPSDVIVHSDVDNLDILPSFQPVVNPQKIFLNSAYKDMLETLGENYDWIIIDTPPMNMFGDFSIINKYCDGNVLVVNKQTDIAGDIKKALVTSKENSLGLAINRVYIKKTHYGKNGYDHYYNPKAVTKDN